MSTPFLGEIRLFSFGFAPKGWAMCNGQILPINQNQALFALLGTTYGGNGTTTFQLPNLMGRVPLERSGNLPIGSVGGQHTVTLQALHMPEHGHLVSANDAAPGGFAASFATMGGRRPLIAYSPEQGSVSLSPATVSTTGGQPHDNHQPYLVLNFCMALAGIFPTRN